MYTCVLLVKACTPEGKPRSRESKMVSKLLTFHLGMFACRVGLNVNLWSGVGTQSPIGGGKTRLTWGNSQRYEGSGENLAGIYSPK